MPLQIAKKMFNGVASYVQYWKGKPVFTYKTMEPWAEYGSFSIPSHVDSTQNSVLNTFKYCSKVKVTLNVTTASTNNQVHVYILYKNGTTTYIGSTKTINTQSVTINAQDIRIRFENSGVNTASGQRGTVTFEPIK